MSTPVKSTSGDPSPLKLFDFLSSADPTVQEKFGQTFALSLNASDSIGPKISHDDVKVQTQKQEVRLRLFDLMLTNLRTSAETNWPHVQNVVKIDLSHLQINTAVLYLLIAFFEDLKNRCKLPLYGVKVFVSFLHCLNSHSLNQENGHRFNAVLKYLEKFPGVKECLQDSYIQSVKQSLKFFMSGMEFDNKTFAEAQKKTPSEEKKPLETCQNLLPHFQFFMRHTLMVMDTEMENIQRQFNPAHETEQFKSLATAARSERCPAPIRETFHENKRFFE